MTLVLQDGHGLVEVVVLHGRRAVENRQGRRALYHEGVRLAAMVKVMAEAGDEHAESLCVRAIIYWAIIVSFNARASALSETKKYALKNAS